MLTVDAQILGRRRRDVRNRFQLPPGLSVMNLMPAGQRRSHQDAQGSRGGRVRNLAVRPDPFLERRDVVVRPDEAAVLLKGIVHPDDARLAVEHGAAGVFVSNHGGRQRHGSATVEALPEIVAAVDVRIEVLVDGGIRRSTDVVKALALWGAGGGGGASRCCGGLAAGGQRGVEHVLELLRAEVDLAMGLVRLRVRGEIDEDILL